VVYENIVFFYAADFGGGVLVALTLGTKLLSDGELHSASVPGRPDGPPSAPEGIREMRAQDR
jgi:hypothetical protein